MAHILIVEDDPSINHMIAEFLSVETYMISF